MSRKPKNTPPEVKETPTEETILPTEEETPVEEVQEETPTEEPLEIFKDNFEKVVEAEKEKANSFMAAWNKIVEVRS